MNTITKMGRALVLGAAMIGLGVLALPAHADPPSHAPAYGYRDRSDKRDDRRNDQRNRYDHYDRNDRRDRNDRDNNWNDRRREEDRRQEIIRDRILRERRQREIEQARNRRNDSYSGRMSSSYPRGNDRFPNRPWNR